MKSLRNYEVKAMNAKYLEGCIAGATKRCEAAELEPIIARFDERCRTLEF